MNHLQKSVFSWSEAEANEAESEEPSFERIRLDEIRRTSNVIQALENVMVQCEDMPDFNGMQVSLQSFLSLTRRRLQELIHQP